VEPDEADNSVAVNLFRTIHIGVKAQHLTNLVHHPQIVIWLEFSLAFHHSAVYRQSNGKDPLSYPLFKLKYHSSCRNYHAIEDISWTLVHLLRSTVGEIHLKPNAYV
jgi:hypothetical protein